MKMSLIVSVGGLGSSVWALIDWGIVSITPNAKRNVIAVRASCK